MLPRKLQYDKMLRISVNAGKESLKCRICQFGVGMISRREFGGSDGKELPAVRLVGDPMATCLAWSNGQRACQTHQ